MKRSTIALISILPALSWACDIIPAEETVMETGAIAFSASFNAPSGSTALWNASDRLIVVDSKDKLHKFTLDVGKGTENGEFSGDITPGSTVKYVAYSSDVNNIIYDSGTSSFTMTVPSRYNAKAAEALITANNAAIGILEGNDVELISVCGFIKFSLEPNGQTFSSGGITYPLTDVKSVSFTDNDGLMFAGKIKASWSSESHTTLFDSVSDGSSSITFSPRILKDDNGNIYYQAGTYYIPVAPQNYEDVTISVEDTEGNKATAIKKKALNVQTASASDLNTISWPTVVVSVNLKCTSVTESNDKHPDIMSWPKYNYEVDRVSETTGEIREGEAQRYTAIPFTESGLEFQVWASEGYAKYHVSNTLYDIILNNYYTGWNNSGDSWTGGSTHGYAWIRIPEYKGVLYKAELEVLSRSTGPVHLATSVDAGTGAPVDILYTIPDTPKSAFKIYEIPVTLNKSDTPYYFVFGDGHYYRIRSWKLYYKVYE